MGLLSDISVFALCNPRTAKHEPIVGCRKKLGRSWTGSGFVLEIVVHVELSDRDLDADFGHAEHVVAGEGGDPPHLVRSFPLDDPLVVDSTMM